MMSLIDIKSPEWHAYKADVDAVWKARGERHDASWEEADEADFQLELDLEELISRYGWSAEQVFEANLRMCEASKNF